MDLQPFVLDKQSSLSEKQPCPEAEAGGMTEQWRLSGNNENDENLWRIIDENWKQNGMDSIPPAYTDIMAEILPSQEQTE